MSRRERRCMPRFRPRARVAPEPRVVKVVHDRGDEGDEPVHVADGGLEVALVQEPVGCVQHVRGMDGVVVCGRSVRACVHVHEQVSAAAQVARR